MQKEGGVVRPPQTTRMCKQTSLLSWCGLALLLCCTRCQGFSLQHPDGVSFIFLSQRALAYLPRPARAAASCTSTSSTRLFGLVEWRAHQQGNGSDDNNISNDCTSNYSPSNTKRDILLLPFRVEEALVPGQSVTITLKHGRFMDLFQDAMDGHDCILGMVLLDDDGIGTCPTTIVLCEIQDFQVDAGFRGKITIEVTLQAVGRASLLELTAWKPIMMGVCQELVDIDNHVYISGKNGKVTSVSNDKKEAIIDLLMNIQSTLEVLGKQHQFQQAYTQAFCIGIDAEDKSASDPKIPNESRTAKLWEPSDIARDPISLAASSWAVWAAADVQYESKSVLLPETLSNTSALERLKLGLKVLLEERFQRADQQAGLSEETVSPTSLGGSSDSSGSRFSGGAFE